ncbi:MAG: CehA/McbA family metallohydrolase [Candidatus Sumerlaeia bacterium]|nr:CehA/McbA family metallohydrolase [Candidatus Sumerlaeia bacterium]
MNIKPLHFRFLFPIGLLALLLPALLTTGPAHTFSAAFVAEMEAVLEEDIPADYAPWDEARLFAWRLSNHAIYLMDTELLAKTVRAHGFLEAADCPTLESPDDGHRLRHHGQQLLLEVLDQIPQVQRIHFENAQSITAHQHVFQLSGTSGVLLFRIDDGGDGMTLLTKPYTHTALDLATVPEPVQALPLEYQPGGVTWVMYRVRNAPPDGMLTFMQPEPRGDAPRPGMLTTGLSSGPLGTLHLEVVDERGRVVPALVNLINQSTNALYRPSGALELAPQMGDISGEPVPSPSRPLPEAGEPFPHSMPGRDGGYYWLVAESSRMALPAGNWQIRIWKGPEYRLVVEEFEVQEKSTTTLSIPMERWVNMAEAGWFSGDAHIHSQLMSDQDADRLMAWMEGADLHVGNIVRMGNYARTYFEQRGFGPDFRVQRGNRALVPGQEDPRFNQGHSLALNIDRPIRDQSKYMFTDWVARETAKAGGIYGAAHVQYNGFNVRRDLVMLLPQNLTHFGEVMQIGQLGTDLYYEVLNMGFKLTAVAGSDVPYGNGLGIVRYYVYTGNDALDVDAWFDAMKGGRTFVSTGPMLDFTVNGELPGTDIAVEEGDVLQVSARAWTAPDPGKELRSLEIHVLGDVFKTVNGGDSSHELTIEMEIPAGFGGWVTVRAETRDGSTALATPVYFTREGFRRWNYDQMPALFAMVEETLSGLEEELQRAIDDWESQWPPEWNMFARATAEMAPLQLEKNAKVRTLYGDLEERWREEGFSRKNGKNGDGGLMSGEHNSGSNRERDH